MDGEIWITISEAALTLGIPQHEFRRRVSAGILPPATKRCEYKFWRLLEIEAIRDGRPIPPPPEKPDTGDLPEPLECPPGWTAEAFGKLIPVKEVLLRAPSGWTPQQVLAARRKGLFPVPAYADSDTSLWRAEEVVAWFAANPKPPKEQRPPEQPVPETLTVPLLAKRKLKKQKQAST